jgi:hypothetical protein
MAGSAEVVQRFVHTVETGAVALWIRRTLAAVGLFAVALLYMFHFRGLATSQAMDQAQIGRSIASGHGWHTNFARPRAIGQLEAHGKDVHRRLWIDTYNAPLPPLFDAVALLPLRSHLAPSPNNLVPPGEKAIAAMSVLLFLGSVGVLYFVARRLFDKRVALLGCSLVLLCDSIWQYSYSGLPQMLLLLLFNATLYALVRAVEAKYSGRRVGPWLVAVGAGFGLLALAHALTIWIFLGLLVFMAFFFRPRAWAAALALAAFLLIYTPWLVRNYIVCGNPCGLAIYSALDGIRHSEAGWLRSVNLDLGGIGPGAFRDKAINNLVLQTGRIVEYFGWSIAALAFFAAVLHVFKRNETNTVRWIILVMWAGAVLGMAVFGIREEQGFAANQLHLLLIPIMTCYGLAYLLVQWNRLGIDLRIARAGFLALIFLLCGLPMLNSLVTMLFGAPKPAVRWPPYVPPYLAIINKWVAPADIVASDIPWAVAWYADRHSLWIPDTIKSMTELSDYGILGGRVSAVYLTPFSGSQNTLGDIVKGEYRDWAPLIQKTATPEKLSFKWGTLSLGFDNECIFMSDHDPTKAPGG